jgi:hypothetical protein
LGIAGGKANAMIDDDAGNNDYERRETQGKETSCQTFLKR